MLARPREASSARLGFSARFSPLLPAERSLLVAHLAQTGSHGLKLYRLDVIDGGMVREADRLVFFMAEEAAFQLTRDRHFHSSIDFQKRGQRGSVYVHVRCSADLTPIARDSHARHHCKGL